MKTTLKDLTNQKIDKLVINSLEQALYQAIVVIDNEERLVWDYSGKTLLTHSLTEMQNHFAKLDVAQTVIRHESPYDEMIGQGTIKDNRIEVPIGSIQIR